MHRILISIITIIGLFCYTCLFAQQQKSERKSISYVNALWLATPEAKKVTEEQLGVMLSTIKEFIEMDRFDYNPLPQSLISEFVEAANAEEKLTIKELSALMEKILTPKIEAILQIEFEMRALELVSDEKKQGFLVTKAKTNGITLDEIEKVMNSAYIYIPVLTGYERTLKKTTYTYNLKGGVIWFQVKMNAEKPVVELKIQKETSSMGFGSDEEAFTSAIRNLARNLQVATRAIDDFKLTAPIAEVDDKNITFGLGTKEGIYKDDPYLVGEWIMDMDGETTFEKTGWVRIGNVGDNKSDPNARSNAWPIKSDYWAPGMMVVEHPRLNIDIALKPALQYMRITWGNIPILGQTDFLRIKSNYSGFIGGADIDAQMNLASITGVSQLFFIVGGHFALPIFEFEMSSTYDDVITVPPFVWGFHGGMMKKFYFGRMAFNTELKSGIRYFTVVQKFASMGSQYTYTIKNNTIGGKANFGLEYALTPDVNIGFMGGYRYYLVSDIWSASLTGPGIELTDDFTADNTFPTINHSGASFSLYLHYTPMSLPFDPISLIRSNMIKK